jgi:hypothetical protein
LSTCGNVKVPALLIRAQTLIDGSDIGHTLLTVCDTHQYYKCEPLPKSFKCEIEYVNPNKLLKTQFKLCCPKIVSVLKGEGLTAQEKAMYLFRLYGLTDFRAFYQTLLTYALLRLFLSRLLYGDFNVNYLLGKYYKDFIHDLNHSRFCAFADFFLNCESAGFGFEKYFKKCLA